MASREGSRTDERTPSRRQRRPATIALLWLKGRKCYSSLITLGLETQPVQQMLEDLTDALRSQLKDRIGNPLSGAFAISWIAWNYKFILAAFSSLDIREKLEFIDSNFFVDPWSLTDPNSLLLRGIVFPALTALAYLLVYPYPSMAVYRLVTTHKLRLRSARQEIEDQRLLSVEESRDLYRQLASVRAERDKEVSDLRAQTSALQKQLEDSYSDSDAAQSALVRELQSEIEHLKNRVQDFESNDPDPYNPDGDGNATAASSSSVSEDTLMRALALVGENPHSSSIRLRDIGSYNSLVLLERDLKALIDQQLIAEDRTGDYVITDAGRNVLVRVLES